jgi:hypothetical protein
MPYVILYLGEKFKIECTKDPELYKNKLWYIPCFWPYKSGGNPPTSWLVPVYFLLSTKPLQYTSMGPKSLCFHIFNYHNQRIPDFLFSTQCMDPGTWVRNSSLHRILYHIEGISVYQHQEHSSSKILMPELSLLFLSGKLQAGSKPPFIFLSNSETLNYQVSA